MFEMKENSLIIYLTGEFILKEGEMSTIILEFGDKGVIKKLEVDGIKRDFVEQRQIYVKAVKQSY